MGRPITSPQRSQQQISRSNIRFARGWLTWSVVVCILCLLCAVLDGAGALPWVSVLYAFALFMAIVMGIGFFVILIAYAPRPPHHIMSVSIGMGAMVGLVFWNWAAAPYVFVASFILWTVLQTLYDLWFREDQIIRDKKPRAIWPERSN